jgi:hypothetical protein
MIPGVAMSEERSEDASFTSEMSSCGVRLVGDPDTKLAADAEYADEQAWYGAPEQRDRMMGSLEVGRD